MTTDLDDALCPECGYSLRGLPSQRCPECGLDLAPLRTLESRIPWVHRRRLGRIRAFYQTAFFVMFGYRMFRAEMVRPVSFQDAQRFRWVIVVQAWLTLVALWPAWRWMHPQSFINTLGEVGLLDWPAILGAVVVFLWLAALTGIHTYFFHPRWMPVELQNRAVALSYYMSTPVALLLPLVVLFGVGTWVGLRLRFKFDELVTVFGLSIFVAVMTPLWLDVMRLAREVLRRALRTWVVALAVPLAGLLLTALILVALPLTVVYAVQLVGRLFA